MLDKHRMYTYDKETRTTVNICTYEKLRKKNVEGYSITQYPFKGVEILYRIRSS